MAIKRYSSVFESIAESQGKRINELEEAIEETIRAVDNGYCYVKRELIIDYLNRVLRGEEKENSDG